MVSQGIVCLSLPRCLGPRGGPVVGGVGSRGDGCLQLGDLLRDGPESFVEFHVLVDAMYRACSHSTAGDSVGFGFGDGAESGESAFDGVLLDDVEGVPEIRLG